MEEKKNVPKRRFEGFEGEWEQHRLGESYHVTMGQSPQSSNYTKNPDDHILVQGNADITNGKIVPRVWTKQITKNAEKGDVILTVRAPVGEVAISNYDIVLGRGVAALKGSYFLYSLLMYMEQIQYWDRFSTGSTFESINSDNIENAIIFIPNILEQQQIGQFFQQLDNLIELHQQKLQKLKAQKQAYLSEMFPQEGETKPKRRFAGFDGEWGLLKLSELVDKAVDNRGKTPPIDNDGNHPLIEVASLGNGTPDYSKVEKYLNEYSFNNHLRGYIQKNDILFSTVGRIGLVSLMDNRINAAIAQNIVGFRAKEGFNPQYLYSLLSTKRSQNTANRIVMGAVQPSIKVSQLKNVEYCVTDNFVEQQKIGAFFQKLDSLIEKQEERVKKYQALKQAYLNEMFV